MPRISTIDGQDFEIDQPTTVSGTLRRLEAAQEAGKYARVKQGSETIGVNPLAVSIVTGSDEE